MMLISNSLQMITPIIEYSCLRKTLTLKQGLSRNVERTKSISATTMNFFSTIDAHALELKRILEESKTSHQKQLLQLQTKFEVIIYCKFM
jgi:hypothetical protein